MTLKTSAYLLLISICTACTWAHNPDVKAAISRDTLNYQHQKYVQYAEGCKVKSDSTCTTIKLEYPLFKNEAILNDSVHTRLAGYFPAEKRDTSWKELTAQLMEAYQADMKDTSRRKIFYNINAKVEVTRQDSNLTTLQITGYAFTGGAHGNSYTSFINWNTKQHRNLKLDDILVAGYQPKLNAIAEKIFRKQENLSDTASLARDYFFKAGKFSLNDNFLITPIGLRFFYNQYEIKPYAAGTTDLVVPYNKIKMLIKPGTVIKQYLK